MYRSRVMCSIPPLLACIVLTLLLPQGAAGQDQPIDTIYLNGKVITADPNFTIAEAFAVRGDKFVAVGDNASVRRLADKTTQIIDLNGHMVMPGLIDTHVHFGPTPVISLRDLRSVSEILGRIADVATVATPGAWIVTSPIGVPPTYFNEPERLVENRWPTREELDRVAPNNPVYIPTPGTQPTAPAIFNSVALSELGVSRNAPDDKLVRIGKDENGDLTGYIYGLTFYSHGIPLYQKLSAALPKPSENAILSGVARGLADYLSFGVTSIYAAHGFSPIEFRGQVQEVSERQAVPRIVSAHQIPPKFAGMESPIAAIETWMEELTLARGAGSGDDMFWIQGVTVPMDGATQAGGALFHEPYLNPYGEMSNGSSLYTTEELIAIGRLALQYDLRLNIVPAGDAACEMAVKALQTIHSETPITDKRWVLQHYQHPTREQLYQLKDMGIVVQTYSFVDYSKGADVYVRRFPGRDIWKTAVPLRWYFEIGVPVAQGPDGRQKNPAFGMWDILSRVDGATGISMLTPSKAITRREALKMYTVNGALVLQREDRIGSIEPGKLADFAVWDHDVFMVPKDEVKDAKVLLTVLGGEVAYRAPFLADEAFQ